MRIHYLQHVPFENLGNIENWALEKGFSLTCTKLFEEENLPEFESFDFLIILGGPMNIYEEDKYSWLKPEKEFIKKTVEKKKKVLGICLGAQLIADVLGAKVYPNKYKEIGWFPVEINQNADLFNNLPANLNVIHWHGDTFDIPKDAVPVASSEACRNQGFVCQNNVIGLQFHLETSPESLKNLIESCREEIKPEKFIQTAEYMLSQDEKFEELKRNLYLFLDNIIAPIIIEREATKC